MEAYDTVSIEIYSNDTTMYTAYFYYEYDGGALVHDDIHSPTPQAGSDAAVYDYPEFFVYEVSAVDVILEHVYPGIHFIFNYTLTDFPGTHTLELYDENFEFVLDTLLITSAMDVDLTPPTPNPMTWSSAPAQLDSTSITMTATTAYDPSAVQYFFDCVSGGCHDSGWQDQTSYTDSNLFPNVQYTYRVKARDKSSNLNETNWSNQASVSFRGIIYVDANATGANNGSSWANAYKYLKDALWAVEPNAGFEIWVAQGTYRPDEDSSEPNGSGNRNEVFVLYDGTTLYGGFHSGGGWASRNPDLYQTILSGDISPDSSDSYYVVNGSSTDTGVIDGFTITGALECGMYNYGGYPTIINCTFSGNGGFEGGGMYNQNSSPTLTNCTFSNNRTSWAGGAIFNYESSPILTNCRFIGNDSNTGGGILNAQGNLTLTGCTFIGNSANDRGGGIANYSANLTMTDCNFIGNTANTGDGLCSEGASIISLGEFNYNFIWDEFYIGDTSKIQGIGVIYIGLGGEMIIDSNAVIDLSDPNDPNTGAIYCDGLLKVKGNGQLKHARVSVSRQAGGYFGKFLVEGHATATNLDIYADGDRYMDVDPCTFTGTIANNRIYVWITESDGSLELRGRNLASPPCDFNDPNVKACQIDDVNMPAFDTNYWTLEYLWVMPGAKVTLVDRFDSNNGYPEVLHVKNLVLDANSVLNVGFEHLYYTNLTGDPNSIMKGSLLGFSLDVIDSDSNAEYQSRVSNNNYIDPADPNNNRIQVERVTGQSPDPNGFIMMHNLADANGQMVFARAKGAFAPAVEDEIRIRFNYLFDTNDPCVQIVVYLSDVPEMLEPDDPCRAYHYIEVGRVSAPPSPRPGSAGSGRYGNFDKFVSTVGLDLSRGTWIELELNEPVSGLLLSKYMRPMGFGASEGGGGGGIDDWDAGIFCDWGGMCLDLNFSEFVEESDFMVIVSGAGSVDVPTCADGSLGRDGYVDEYDAVSWDWTLNLEARKNLCGGHVSLGGGATGFAMGGFGSSEGLFNFSYNSDFLNYSDFSDLLISGKRGTADRQTKLKDRLYVFDSNCNYMQSPNLLTSERCNIRVVRGEGNDFYVINSESGVSDLNTGEPIVPPGQTDVNSEPRYGQPATVYVGIQGPGSAPYGRPIFDAAFDASGFVYVVPVVVVPAGVGNDPYAAAAKLQLDTNWPPYHIIKLYDEPVPVADNQRDYRNTLRDIELDSAGNVYVTNANATNESDILWKFEPNNGAIHRLDLGNPNSPLFLRAPVGMCVSSSTNTLYLASSLSNNTNYNASVIHGLSTTTLSPVRTITISGMQHVTSMTEDPVTKTLWVTGFNFNSRLPAIAWKASADILPFYDPYIAKIPLDPNNVSNVSAIRCVVDANDLAMPLSICWTGALPQPEKCGGADLSGDGVVNLKDLAKLAAYWLSTNCGAPDNPCNGADLEPQQIPDGDVDLSDLDVMADNWLNTNCQ